MAVSGTLLVACASGQNAGSVTPAYPSMVVDNYRAPTAAELYAQRFQVSVAQLSVDDTHRFVLCREACPAVTPKTPVASLNAAVLRRMRSSRRSEPPSDTASTTERDPLVEAPAAEAVDVVPMRPAHAPIDGTDAPSAD